MWFLDPAFVNLIANLSGGSLIAVVMVWFVRTVIKDRQDYMKAQAEMMDSFGAKTQKGLEKVADRLEGMTKAVVESVGTTRNVQESVNDLRDQVNDVRTEMARNGVHKPLSVASSPEPVSLKPAGKKKKP